VAQLYPQALGFLFVTSYDLLGYRGGILTHLYIGLVSLEVDVKFATDGQSASLELMTSLPFCLTITGFLMLGTLFDERLCL
jgi:hypothetical protein